MNIHAMSMLTVLIQMTASTVLVEKDLKEMDLVVQVTIVLTIIFTEHMI